MFYAMSGTTGIIEPAFVYLPGVPGGDVTTSVVDGLDYFSVPVELGVCSFLVIILLTFENSHMELQRHMPLARSQSMNRNFSRQHCQSSRGILKKASVLSSLAQSCKML
jgi:hypothetical protein